MIRVLLYFILVGLLAFGVAWLADRPGEVSVVWHGLRIDTSVMVAAVALVLTIAAAVFVWSLLRTVLRTPDLLSMYLRNRRGTKGYLAISRGLIAIGTGDVRAARKFEQEARRLASGQPLALLLSAQTAQLSGDRPAAERAFSEMVGRPDTKLLGLRGLFVEAQRRDDPVAARAYAEEAVKAAPVPAWAGQAVLEFRCAAGDWSGALAILESNMRNGVVDRVTYRRHRAVLLTAQALAAEETDRDSAKTLIFEAVKLAPTLVPAAALAGRLLAEAGELRKAGRMLERAWKENPHPDLAETYAHLRFGDSARDRLVRVEMLAQKAPGHVESALAVARAALDAREFAKARSALAPLLAQPSQRVSLLMAELEQVEHGDEGRSREWMGRAVHAARDPAWTADGFVSERWLPVSPVSGRLDTFQWKVPLAELGSPLAADHASKLFAIIDASASEKSVPAAGPKGDDKQLAEENSTAAPLSPVAARPETPAPEEVRKPMAETVIPLVQAPDDPGPEHDAEPEPAPEPGPDGWSKFRQLFK
ncbi:MAG: HemY protein [Alphaproteobacteria bacterium]|jgi:HemY protein|nr:HemY protein [Alphaproteobacteria bacterium]